MNKTLSKFIYHLIHYKEVHTSKRLPHNATINLGYTKNFHYIKQQFNTFTNFFFFMKMISGWRLLCYTITIKWQNLGAYAIMERWQIDLQNQIQYSWINRALQGKTHSPAHSLKIYPKIRYRLYQDLCSFCQNDLDLHSFSTNYHRRCQNSLNGCQNTVSK